MSAIIFGLLTLLLILVSGYLILIILMQRASSAGMGSAMGGGAAESALGAGAGNVLTKGTIIGAAAFFILCFSLYLGLLAQAEETGPVNTLPTEIAAPDAQSTQNPSAPLVNLPEGMDWTAGSQALQNDSTTTVTSDQGTMIVTEDAIEVTPSTEATESAEQTADDAKAAVEEAAPAAESSETKPE